MSIMPGELMDLHEYEHRLIEFVLCGIPVLPPSPAPVDQARNPRPEFEVVLLVRNREKANALYNLYMSREKR